VTSRADICSFSSELGEGAGAWVPLQCPLEYGISQQASLCARRVTRLTVTGQPPAASLTSPTSHPEARAHISLDLQLGLQCKVQAVEKQQAGFPGRRHPQNTSTGSTIAEPTSAGGAINLPSFRTESIPASRMRGCRRRFLFEALLVAGSVYRCCWCFAVGVRCVSDWVRRGAGAKFIRSFKTVASSFLRTTTIRLCPPLLLLWSSWQHPRIPSNNYSVLSGHRR